MGIAERIIHAETSSDLRHHERVCDVDVIGAVGMAAASLHGEYLALYRLKFENDKESHNEVKKLLILWARRSLIRRKVASSKAVMLANKALGAWLFDVCNKCGGTGYPTIEGTPSLAQKACPTCNGSGKNVIAGSPDEREIIKEIIDRANDAVVFILKATKRKLKDG